MEDRENVKNKVNGIWSNEGSFLLSVRFDVSVESLDVLVDRISKFNDVVKSLDFDVDFKVEVNSY